MTPEEIIGDTERAHLLVTVREIEKVKVKEKSNEASEQVQSPGLAP